LCAVFWRGRTWFFTMNRDMPLDGIRRFVVLRDADSVKFHDVAQFIDQDFEKLFWFAVRAHGLGDADARLVARRYRLLQWLDPHLRHFAHEGLDAANRQVGSPLHVCEGYAGFMKY